MKNEKISKNYLKVLTSLNSKKFRQKYQLFIVEGDKIVSELIHDNPSIIRHLIVSSAALEPFLYSKNHPVYIADEAQLNKISSMSTPPSILAVCDMDSYFKVKPFKDYPFELYLEDIRDPGNIGTILRTAEWFGIGKVYLSEDSVDPFHPRLIQSSMGSFFRLEVNVLPFNEIAKLKKPLIGTSLDGTALNTWVIPPSGTIIMGNESRGISKDLSKKLDVKLKILPATTNEAESLNVGIAAGIILYAIQNHK